MNPEPNNTTLLSLTEFLQTAPDLSKKEILELLKPAMESLCELHRAGSFYGMITPEHIFVSKETAQASFCFRPTSVQKKALAKQMHAFTTHLSNLESAPFLCRSQSLDELSQYSSWLPLDVYDPQQTYGIQSDVYGFAAVFYYALTQTIPPTPFQRISNTADIDIQSLPLNQVQKKALTKAFELFASARTTSIEPLFKSLYPAKPVKKTQTKQNDKSTFQLYEIQLKAIESLCTNFKKKSQAKVYEVRPNLVKGLKLTGKKIFLGHDDTLFQSGKNGFAITDTGLVCCNIFETPHEISYQTLANAKQISISSSGITADSLLIAYCSNTTAKKELLSLYERIHKILQAISS